MDKVSYYFKIFKELWGNKRYRALIIIGCYALFFGFVLISLNTPGENTYNVTLVPKTPEVYILINVHIYDKDWFLFPAEVYIFDEHHRQILL